jgi:hypothetical protein
MSGIRPVHTTIAAIIVPDRTCRAPASPSASFITGPRPISVNSARIAARTNTTAASTRGKIRLSGRNPVLSTNQKAVTTINTSAELRLRARWVIGGLRQG